MTTSDNQPINVEASWRIQEISTHAKALLITILFNDESDVDSSTDEPVGGGE
jgi:hypothetical protein